MVNHANDFQSLTIPTPARIFAASGQVPVSDRQHQAAENIFRRRTFPRAAQGANVPPIHEQQGNSDVAEIILVRHGQANAQATDEASYDRLSDLGRQQADWLGVHMRTTNPHFDRVLTGTLSRQADTARGMGYEITTQDPRLNELSYFSLAHALEDQHGIPAPRDATEFATHLPQVIDHWTRNRLEGVPERFDAFTDRITAALDEACHMPGRTLIVTSGGVIGMALRHTLGLENGGMAKIMLQIMNSSVHRLEYVHDMLMLGAFNATPHLDSPDRAHARTFV